MHPIKLMFVFVGHYDSTLLIQELKCLKIQIPLSTKIEIFCFSTRGLNINPIKKKCLVDFVIRLASFF